MRPSCMTRIRSLMPSTSGSSEEIMMTATPFSTRLFIRLYISTLAPTSMPRVGSSKMRTLDWLSQPLRQHHLLLIAAAQVLHLLVNAGGRDPQLVDETHGLLSFVIRLSSRLLVSRSRLARLMLWSTDSMRTRPCCLRSSAAGRPRPGSPAAAIRRGSPCRRCRRDR